MRIGFVKSFLGVQDFIAYPLYPYYKTENTYNDLTEKQKESLKTFENGFVGELKEVKQVCINFLSFQKNSQKKFGLFFCFAYNSPTKETKYK